MGKVSKADAPNVITEGPVEDRSGEVDGYAIGFTKFSADIDGAPLLKGLPGDMCIAPHWGYVISGSVTFSSPGGNETFVAGDAFYVPAGHTPAVTAGTEFLLFTPAEEANRVNEVMMQNMMAAAGAQG